MGKIQASFIFLSCYPIISVPVKNPSNAGGVHRDRIFDHMILNQPECHSSPG